MADPENELVSTSSTKPPSPDNAGPIIEESQESEEYQQDLQVVLGTAFGVIAVVGLISLGLLLYRLYRARSSALSHNQNDDLNLFERDLSLDVTDKSEGYPLQPTVLMLYAQDCPIHERMVAALASFLMEGCGCVVSLDLLEEAELSQRGLDDWLVERLQEADFILTVCSLGARLRCSKKHIRFRKWSQGNTAHRKGNKGGPVVGDDSLSSSPTMKKLKDKSLKKEKDESTTSRNSNGETICPLSTSLTGEIPDYFAIAVDYVAEKMRVEEQKGLGLAKFINVYFDYSARSDIPPQLEMAAQYCLMREMKLLRQHLMGTSSPNTYQNGTNERDEGITIMGDSSEKSDDGEDSHQGHPCNILETETGMMLHATLEQAKAFFRENPTWMEEQMERACPPSSHPQSSPFTGFFSKGTKSKRWRRRRRHQHHGQSEESYGNKDKSREGRESVKEPLLGLWGRGEVEDNCLSASSSLLSPMTLHQKLSGHRLGFPKENREESQHFSHWSDQDDSVYVKRANSSSNKRGSKTRNTLPRSRRTKGSSGNSKEWIDNERSLGLDVDAPSSLGIFHSRQNSLPSSLASSRTAAVSGGIDADGTNTLKVISATPVPPSSCLLPTSCLSKSADSFALNRDYRQWHPLDTDVLPCLYCNSTELDRGCSRCRPGHNGRLKGAQNHDIDPGFSSSTEGVPALLHSSSKNNSQSQTTILQAEVHQDWRAGQDFGSLTSKESLGADGRVWNSELDITFTGSTTLQQRADQDQVFVTQPPPYSLGYWHSKVGVDLQVSKKHTNKDTRDGSPSGMRRWVSGIVESPKRWNSTANCKSYTNGVSHPANFHHTHRSPSRASSLSSNEDSASVSSSCSASDGDSLERDLRSIQKISSFHDFVVSSSFVDTHDVTFTCPTSLPPLPHSLSLLPSVPTSSHNV